jgi:hypothetical protein
MPMPMAIGGKPSRASSASSTVITSASARLSTSIADEGPAAERKVATALFADLVSFTAMSERLEPDILLRIIGTGRGADGQRGMDRIVALPRIRLDHAEVGNDAVADEAADMRRPSPPLSGAFPFWA